MMTYSQTVPKIKQFVGVINQKYQEEHFMWLPQKISV